MKYMYSIGYRKPNNNVIYLDYVGGDSEEEAKASAISSAVSFHNKYSNTKLTDKDLTIVECKLSGDYKSVLADLSRG